MDGWRSRQLSRELWLEEAKPSSRLDVFDLLRTVSWRDLQCVGEMSSAKERGTMNQEMPLLVITSSTLIFMPLSSDHLFPCECCRVTEMYCPSLMACNNRNLFPHSSGDLMSGIESPV